MYNKETHFCERQWIYLIISELRNNLAPELTELFADFSPATDIWSLGVLLFELTTTSFYTEEEAQEKLKEVKEDPYILEEVFEEVAKVSLIRPVLLPDFRCASGWEYKGR